VRRGNLLVIPIGRALLYVEPIYLQAERSPMPELRLVVVATEERLGYGPSFEEAMKSLFGEAAGATLAQAKPEETKQETAKGADAKPSETPATPQGSMPPETQRLLNQALDDLEAYQRLTAQGKLGEAGQKLESAKRALEEAKRQQKSP
jgi:uncharacterized membrane protein (UPF0182 family)